MKFTLNVVETLSVILVYPVLCVLFYALDLGMSWGYVGTLIALFGFCTCFFIFGDTVSRHPSLSSTLGHAILSIVSWVIILTAAFSVIYSGGREAGLILASEAGVRVLPFIAVVVSIFIVKRLIKGGIIKKRLENNPKLLAILWVLYAFFAAILSSVYLQGIFTPVTFLDFLMLI